MNEATRLRFDPDISIEECPEVYPPREDSWLLLSCLEPRKGERMLDMGCGTGFIGLHCAKEGCSVTAVDISPRAVNCARRNARENSLELEIFLSDLFLDVEGSFDLMVFNPPYVPDAIQGGVERSWAGGEDGVSVLERFLIQAPSHLHQGGRIYVLLSSVMRPASLQCALSQYVRDRLRSQRIFFEELWVERLVLRC